jgi:hypothetical protein
VQFHLFACRSFFRSRNALIIPNLIRGALRPPKTRFTTR